jgi:hypothetical protein
MLGISRSTCLLTVMAIVAVVNVVNARSSVAAGNPAGQTKPAAGTSEACTLLTKEIAAAALGEAVAGPKSTVVPAGASGPGGGAASSCEYTGSGLHTVHLNVMHFDAATAAVYKGLCAQKTKDGLTGLGEVACWYNPKHEELQVLKGTTFLSIEMRRAGDPTESIKGAAKKIYDALK